MYKQIAWEERQDDLHPLPVLPDPDGLVGGKKRLNLSQVEVLDDRFFILWNGKDRIPIATARGIQHHRIQECLLFKRSAYRLLVHPRPLAQLQHPPAPEANSPSLCG